RAERSEDGMGHGVRAECHHTLVQARELVPAGEVEFVVLLARRLEARRRGAYRLLRASARRDGERLHPLDEGLELGGSAERGRELHERRRRERAQALARLVVPEPCAALDQAWADG